MNGGIPFLLHFLLTLTLIILIVKTAQSIVFTACGGEVKNFGLALSMGFHPRFYIDRSKMFQLSRQKLVWTFATPLLIRLGIIVLGVLTWLWDEQRLRLEPVLFPLLIQLFLNFYLIVVRYYRPMATIC